jgi:group I intron endonuclease
MSKNIYTFHYTYLITNTNTQMKYIGVRSCNCLPENDDGYMGSSKILGEAMQETPEVFTKTIIDTFPTREIANTNEQWLHETYDVARNSMFYNLCIAPKKFNMCGRTHSLETRKKMSLSKSGEKNPFYGKKLSEKTRAKMSEARSGKKHPFYGKKHSEETLKKMSDVKKGKKHSAETRAKNSAANSGDKNAMYGKKHSVETRAKISAALSGEKHPMYGKPVSEEHRKNLTGTRGPQKKTTCPHCLQTGGGSMMNRWHFTNCKEISTIF